MRKPSPRRGPPGSRRCATGRRSRPRASRLGVRCLWRLAKRDSLAYLGPETREMVLDETQRGRVTRDGIRIYEPSDFAGMHKAGELAARILDDIGGHVF